MSRYNKLIKEILDGIFEGYALEDGKLKVVNESAAKSADSALHKLVLEKSRDLWDVLESSTESLADVAEEISFEELNLDPSSKDMHIAASVGSGAEEEVAAQQQMQEPTLESLLGAEDFDLDGIFEVMGLHDGKNIPAPMKPPIKEQPGDEEDVIDGDEDFADLEGGDDDAGMGGPDLGGDEEEMDPEMEPGMEPEGEMGMEPEGDEMGMDLEPEGGEGGMSFDFDLELGGEEGELGMELEPENGDEMGMELEPEGDEEMALEPEGEEEAEEGMGHRMETY